MSVKVQWMMPEAAAEWAKKAAAMTDMDTGPFMGRVIKYLAGELEPWAVEAMEKHLEAAQNILAIEFDEEEK